MICRRFGVPVVVCLGVVVSAALATGPSASRAASAPAAGQPPAAPAPATGLRIDGTFIQIQDRMLKLGAEAWRKELEAVRQAGMKLIVLQFLQRDEKRFFSEGGSGEAGAAEVDAVEAILDYADKNNMEVFLGLAADGEWFERAGEPVYLDGLAATSMELAEAIWKRFGRHRSFAGWYIPTETWDGPFADDAVANFKAFFRRISDHCKRLSGPRPLPVAIAPYTSGKATPAELEACYTAMLTDAGVDIVMFQDGVGARGLDDDLLQIVPAFRAMRNACLAAGVELWADLECFKLVDSGGKRKGFEPTDVDRIGHQMAVESPFVTRIVTFDFFHYMSPYRNEKTRKLNADYLHRFVERNWLPVLGRGPTIDPTYPYYRDRSPESVAAEIRANGYSLVHYVVTAESAFESALLNALHREGIGVWYMTWGNGTYSTKDLPADWPSWRMVTRTELTGGRLDDGFQRLCLNHPEHRAWRKRQIGMMMRRFPFQGVEIVEPHWPEYPGIESPAYGCFCPQCVAAFTKMFPEEKALPEIVRHDAPTSPRGNPDLWIKWLDFRRASLTDFLNDQVNGPGGIRQTAPHAVVGVWSLALAEGVGKVRDDHGQDAEEIARTVRPDVYGLQTHWPDWIRAELPADYVRDYAPFVEQVRRADTAIPILIQADTGSQPQNRRDREWIDAFERACWKMGVTSTTFYEHFIGQYAYDDPPRVVEVRRGGAQQVRLLFTKRLDPASAGDASRYALDEGEVVAAKVDGSVVELTLKGVPRGRSCELTIKGVSDAVDRRLLKDQRPAVLELQALRFRCD